MKKKKKYINLEELGPEIGFPFREMCILKDHKYAVYVVKFNIDGSYCLSGGKDRIIRLWNPYKNKLIQKYDNQHGYEIRDIIISQDNSKFISAGVDRQIFLWDVIDGKVIRRFRSHNQAINALTFNNDNNVFISASDDATVCFWDLRSNMRDPIQVLKEFNDSVTSLYVNDVEIYTGCVDGCIRIFDIRKGQIITDYIGSSIISLCLSNDHNCILVNCLDNKIRLMDKSNGTLLNEYIGHQHKQVILKSCFTNDDSYVISGSEDNQIYIWSLVEGDICHKISNISGVPVTLDYHPTKNILISGSTDGNIRLYH